MQHEGLLAINGEKSFMTASQRLLINIYKIVSIIAVMVVVVAYFGSGSVALFKALFIGRIGNDSKIVDTPFSEVEFIEGYIPGLEDPLYQKPLLACSLQDINRDHIHWLGNFDAYNLFSDLDFPFLTEIERSKVFSCVKRVRAHCAFNFSLSLIHSPQSTHSVSHLIQTVSR